jgi:hypothetical protein
LLRAELLELLAQVMHVTLKHPLCVGVLVVNAPCLPCGMIYHTSALLLKTLGLTVASRRRGKGLGRCTVEL